MATQDDKISNNRRRLFKALSAAPVVATLRPGDALANTSAFQCVTNIADPATDPNLVMIGPTVTDGFAAREFRYWRIGAGESQNSNVEDPYADPQFADVLIVEYVDPDTNAISFYNTWEPGKQDTFDFDGPDTKDAITLKVDAKKVRTVPLAGTGQFAMFGAGVDGDTKFQLVGPYPKINPASSPDLQGITHTCMNSVPLQTAMAGGRRTLTIG